VSDIIEDYIFSIADVSLSFSSGEIKQAMKKTFSMPGLSKKINIMGRSGEGVRKNKGQGVRFDIRFFFFCLTLYPFSLIFYSRLQFRSLCILLKMNTCYAG